MVTCPCCTDVLLHHIQPGKSYWFCRSCWSEMPNFEDYNVENNIKSNIKSNVENVRSIVLVSKTIESDLEADIEPDVVIPLHSPNLLYSIHYSDMAA